MRLAAQSAVNPCMLQHGAEIASGRGKVPHAMERLATISTRKMGSTLYDWDDPADHWYSIVSGAARKCALMSDGRRQILEFLLPGDLFGFGTWDEHRFAVEVVVDGTVVARYPRRHVEMLAETDPEVGRQLRQVVFDAISRLQERIVILGCTSARAKVGSFLLEMERRSSGDHADSISLPMSRYDIADYLSLAVETVSRALTDLRRRGVIALTSTRQIWIIDRGALQDEAEDGDDAAV